MRKVKLPNEDMIATAVEIKTLNDQRVILQCRSLLIYIECMQMLNMGVIRAVTSFVPVSMTSPI